MAKITSRSELNVGTELIINEPNRTIELAVAGNLVAKDGVSWQALYSKLVDLWATATYQDSPFPMNTIDALSGQYQIGIDAGGNANGWKLLNDTVRSYMRDGGCEEYNATGGLGRVYVGIVGLGVVNSGAQEYFQKESGGVAIEFTYDDQCNEMIQVFGDSGEDATTTDFDHRAYFKAYVREQGKKYKDSILADTGKTETGANIVNMLLSNEDDQKISDSDSEMTNAPYTGIGVTYGATTRMVAGVSRNFDKIISNSGAGNLEQIYTKIQYQLRQAGDIDEGAGTVVGRTADSLLYFTGSILECTQGVYIDDVPAEYSNSVKFRDTGNVVRENLYEASGAMTFNPVMVGAGSSYRLMFTSPPGAGNDYGEAGALTVEDASGNPITGVITSGSIGFSFDYDGDTIGGTAGTDKPVTLVGIKPNGSKFAVATGILTRSKVISIGLVAETDRAYS